MLINILHTHMFIAYKYNQLTVQLSQDLYMNPAIDTPVYCVEYFCNLSWSPKAQIARNVYIYMHSKI